MDILNKKYLIHISNSILYEHVGHLICQLILFRLPNFGFDLLHSRHEHADSSKSLYIYSLDSVSISSSSINDDSNDSYD